MPFVDKTDAPNLPVFFNVSMAVGPGASNGKQDVMLIQYFLNGIYDNAEKFTPPVARPAKERLVVDGLMGPNTAKWIRVFQNQVRLKGNSVLVDGRVDRARGVTSSISHTVYTILHLNGSFQKVRPGDFAKLSAAKDLPPDLVGPLTQK